MNDLPTRTDAADAPWFDRVDRGALLKPHRRADGTLLLEGFAAREGVLVYRRADGSSFRELVTADAIRTGASTLARAPVTLGHPPGDEQVTPATYQRLAVGDVDGEVTVEAGGFTRVRMAVRRKDAIGAVEAGTQELSPGYRVRIDATPGVHPEYGPYDARQVERVTNHLAIVDRARGGDAIRVRADGAYAVDAFHTDAAGAAGGDYMINPALARLLALLGVTTRVDSDAAAYDALAAAIAGRNDAAGVEKTKTAALEAARDAEKVRADKAEAKVASMEADEAKRADAAARTDLEALAGKLGVDPKAHAATKDLRKAVATAHLGGTLRADASDAYIDAVIDIAKNAKNDAPAAVDEKRGDTGAFAPTQGASRNDMRAPAKRLGPSALSRLHSNAAAAPATDRGDK